MLPVCLHCKICLMPLVGYSSIIDIVPIIVGWKMCSRKRPGSWGVRWFINWINTKRLQTHWWQNGQYIRNWWLNEYWENWRWRTKWWVTWYAGTIPWTTYWWVLNFCSFLFLNSSSFFISTVTRSSGSYIGEEIFLLRSALEMKQFFRLFK